MITFDKTRKVEWAGLLKEAVNEPGMLSAAYRAFHRFSLLNRISAVIQCKRRGITPGPIASFSAWKEKGRFVKKGEKAISLCMPIFIPIKSDDDENEEEGAIKRDAKGRKMRTIFEYKPNWFVVSQTDGKDAAPEPVPGFDYDQCLEGLNVKRIDFDMPDGNCQGFATMRGGQLAIAISPVAQYPHKTFFHEVAHTQLHFSKDDDKKLIIDNENLTVSTAEVEAECVAYLCISTFDLPGKVESRGYIQSWLDGGELTDAMARRIIQTAESIIKAGMVAADTVTLSEAA